MASSSLDSKSLDAQLARLEQKFLAGVNAQVTEKGDEKWRDAIIRAASDFARDVLRVCQSSVTEKVPTATAAAPSSAMSLT